MFVLECPTTTAPLLLSARSIVTRAVLRARILSSLAYSLLAVSSVRVRVPGTKGVLFRDLSSSSSRQARFLTRRREGPRTAGSQCRSSFDRYLTWREIHCLLRLSTVYQAGMERDTIKSSGVLSCSSTPHELLASVRLCEIKTGVLRNAPGVTPRPRDSPGAADDERKH